MTAYKRLKSVAHNLGHSFLSDSNGLGSPYRFVPTHLYERAREVGADRIAVDFVRRLIEPSGMRTPMIEESVTWYAKQLPRLAESQGVPITSIVSAVLYLWLDLDAEPRKGKFDLPEPREFRCKVEIIDDRGTMHVGEPTEWMA